MSWQIAADIREMFVDVVAFKSSPSPQAICVRTLNRKDQLLSGLSEALTTLSSHLKVSETPLVVKTDWERVAVREHWGGQAAFLTTEGFENLIEIGDQRREHQFGLQANHPVSLISKDYSFGVTERTWADGTVEIGLDEKEIDFVLSKLSLAGVKAVGLCFLHANANAQNEKQLASKLIENGYQVFASHECQGHERQRAQIVIRKAFTATGLKTFAGEIEKLGFDPSKIKVIENAAPQAKPQTLSFDFLEDRTLVTWNENGENKTFELNLSPLSQILLDEGGLVHVGPNKIDSEPGPVAFGKGIYLSLFDMLAFTSKISAPQLPRLKMDSTRVLKQLAPMAKQLRLDPETCAQKYINLAFDMMALELRRHFHWANVANLVMECGGWMASLMGPPLARRLGVKSFEIKKGAQWSTVTSLLGEKLPSDIIASGEFSFEHGALSEGEAFDG